MSQWVCPSVVILETLQDFPSQLFSLNVKPGLHPQPYELADISLETRLISLNDYIKFLSQPVGMLGYFRKVLGI